MGFVVRCLAALVGCSVALVACQTDGAGGAAGDADWFVIETTDLQVPAGDEAFLCYAVTLEEDMAVDRFEYELAPVVHHLVLMEALAPEPEGLSNCDVLFRNTWLPLFIAGNGDAELETPSGTAHQLRAGTQLVIQLHLLNVASADATDRARIRMRLPEGDDLDPIGIYAFGTDQISLPPQARSSVSNDCTIGRDLEVFAIFPHMHYLGLTQTLELVGPDGSMQEVYRRDPWDFDTQSIDVLPLDVSSGTESRVTCTYDNPTGETVEFGESSGNEMCFLVAYVAGDIRLDGCVDYNPIITDPPVPSMGDCDAIEANALGIGLECTQGGGECAEGLACTKDQAQAPGDAPGFCIEIGRCQTTADCGGGDVTCCGTAESGGAIPICTPEACRPSNCIPR